jgi:hypothetical protein
MNDHYGLLIITMDDRFKNAFKVNGLTSTGDKGYYLKELIMGRRIKFWDEDNALFNYINKILMLYNVNKNSILSIKIPNESPNILQVRYVK